MKDLTFRQQQILTFIQERSTEQGYWPSIREIQQEFGFKSTNAVVGHLRALEKKGFLERQPHQARAFRLRIPDNLADDDENVMDVVDIPVMGNIAAGYPDRVESGGQIDTLQVDSFTARQRRNRRTFAIRVRGESMINAGIQDGDTVVVETREPKNGDIVAALIDGETTLKRFVRSSGSPTPYLKAENPDYPELYPIDELIVQGVATSIVRRL
ncbi:transcriptional repressor LexA [Puniceicoccus vermicola]|uniref:Transcriptional repressor LexA n=1 Tax=Puniceicoccus vermicola TaxID=388746 RepID=A0A7X1AWL8_9BACT|nr:transcriptional repressor LexA [Puniceicoccus vermicola]MBC2601321.1 transcriptional repressor LexA [Puniceicoccus vermicola]